MNLYKDKIKLDDWKCFENYLPANKGYLFKFDLKNGYHHIDIFNSYPTYLDFSWNINGSTKHFVFNVLPFCLSSALFVFRKVVPHEWNPPWRVEGAYLTKSFKPVHQQDELVGAMLLRSIRVTGSSLC